MSTNQEGQPCSALSLRLAGGGLHLPSTTHTGNHHHIDRVRMKSSPVFYWPLFLPRTEKMAKFQCKKKNANFLRGGQWQCLTWEHTWMCDSTYKKWLLGVGVDASGVQRFHVGRLLPLPLYAAAQVTTRHRPEKGPRVCEQDNVLFFGPHLCTLLNSCSFQYFSCIA